MEPESGDGRESSSSRRHDAKEDPEVYSTNCSKPLETESSVLSPSILDADDDSALFSSTSSKSSLLEELVRAVTQTQTSLLGNVTDSELRAELVRLQKNNTLMTGNADAAISLCSPNSVTYEKTVAPPPPHRWIKFYPCKKRIKESHGRGPTVKRHDVCLLVAPLLLELVETRNILEMWRFCRRKSR
jgi:hypothetical protein